MEPKPGREFKVTLIERHLFFLGMYVNCWCSIRNACQMKWRFNPIKPRVTVYILSFLSENILKQTGKFTVFRGFCWSRVKSAVYPFFRKTTCKEEDHIKSASVCVFFIYLRGLGI